MDRIRAVIDRFRIDDAAECPCPGCGVPVRGPRGSRCGPCTVEHMRAEFDRLARERCFRARDSVPPRMRWATLGARELGARLARPGVIRVAREVAADRRSAVLIGGSGTGKSSLACAILDAHLEAARASQDEARLERAATSRFVIALELVAEVVELGAGHGTASALWEALRADVLVLDDLGLEPVHPVILRVLKRRWYDERVTIVTTALRAPQVPGAHATAAERCALAVETRYGEGVARTVFERAEVIECAEGL